MYNTFIICQLASAPLPDSVGSPQAPFYYTADFWISTAFGVAGLWLSYLSFREARRAKKAAQDAGKTVKLQTIVIELSEVSQRLDNIDQNLDYLYSRELLNDASRRLRRQLAPVQVEPDVASVIVELFSSLDAAKSALAGVRPVRDMANPGNISAGAEAVFYAMEGHFGQINSKIAELTGLLEKRTILPSKNE